jgi:diguanylate cyclase (GGDEF)-like protein
MPWHSSPLYLLFFATLFFTPFLAVYATRRRSTAGSSEFSWLMLAVFIWQVGYLLELSTPELSSKIFWLKIQQIGILTIPAIWLLLVVRVTNRGEWITPQRLVGLATVPLVTLIIAFTNELHGWYWTGVQIEPTAAPALALQVNLGVVAWIWQAYSFSVLLTAIYLLFRTWSRTAVPYRGQIAVLLVASLAPLSWNVVSLNSIDPEAYLRWFPVFFIMFYVAVTWGIFRFRLLDLVPVARDLLVDNLGDGVLVLDSRNRILDMNPKAEVYLGSQLVNCLGKPVDQAFPNSHRFPTLPDLKTSVTFEIDIPIDGVDHRFEMIVSPLIKSTLLLTGRLIVLRDVSERIKASEGLLRRDAILEAISFAANRFVATESWEDDVNIVLSKLGEATQSSRVYIFHNHRDRFDRLCMSQLHEWCDGETISMADRLTFQNLPYELGGLARWQTVMQRGGSIHGPLVEFPEEEQRALKERDALSLLAAPIFVGNQWWGWIGFDECRQQRGWSQVEVDVLAAAAGTIGSAIQRKKVQDALRQAHAKLEDRVIERTAELAVANATLQDDLEKRKRAEAVAEERAGQLAALHNATTALLSTIDLEVLLGQILDAAISAIGAAEKGMLHMLAGDTGQLEMKAVLGYHDPRIRKHSVPSDRGYINQSVRDRQPLLVEDTFADPHSHYDGDIKEIQEVRSMIIAPLVSDEVVYGAISLESPLPGAFNENDLRLLASFAATATAALKNAQLHAHVQKMALTDALTNVYNRRGFHEFGWRLFESARRFHRPLSVIMIDLDEFKEVNDTWGHAIGDQVLVGVAERLSRNVREVDLLARLGGDEFAILLPETDLPTGVKVAERLRQLLAETPIMTDREMVSISVSIGIARLSTQTEDLSSLIDHADVGLYEAKQNGRNRVKIYPPNGVESASPIISFPDPEQQSDNPE